MTTTMTPAEVRRTDAPLPLSPAGQPPAAPQIEAAATTACGRIAPVWPLHSFVAVNPFLGLSEQRFEQAAQTLAEVAGRKSLMPRAYYRARIQQGAIADVDLEAGLAAAQAYPQAPADLAELKAALAEAPGERRQVASSLAALTDATLGTGLTALVVVEIGKWCAAYFDAGQSTWRMPWQGAGPFAAWRAAAQHDRSPEIAGLSGFRASVSALPADADATIARAVETLGVPAAALEDYLHAALAEVPGWTAYARLQGWPKELHGDRDDTVRQLLAVRLGWELAVHHAYGAAVQQAWTAHLTAMAGAAESRTPDRALLVDWILQQAAEHAFQRDLTARLAAAQGRAPNARPDAQAAFCIDVRSEVYRRQLEAAAGDALETIGFAGFFGVAMEYVPCGHDQGHGHAQCPVLLEPSVTVREGVEGVDADTEAELHVKRRLRKRARRAWKAFKSSAVSSFVYVETMGLGFAAKLAGDAFHLTRTVRHPREEGLDAATAAKLAPRLEPDGDGQGTAGLTQEQRLATAEFILRGMSMTDGAIARLVLLAGHASTTVNNPHASGLDCGACGGYGGEANARVAAAILNDPYVRAHLPERGVTVPEDTWFLAGLHDTTTDEISLPDRHLVPASHARDLAQLEAWLSQATKRTRRERAPALGLSPQADDVDAAIVGRSQDWSQVRPEWALAGNAAFIAAPRSRTRALDLGGRAFLHSYDWRQDAGYKVLELILTAPMVVANWINLQYYGSVVDHDTWGAGNKTLHNVVGTVGVLEGNGGDVRTGLPWQSIHDGEKLLHEPLRLSVVVAAPTEAIEGILGNHANVRELVDNGWLHLFAQDDDGTCRKYRALGDWAAV
jgi:hypothetical protein